MDWFVVDKNYVSYLKKFDDRVGQVEYGEKLKLHIGILIEIADYKYYVPVSSPKEKHNKMSNGLDFHKLVNPEDGTLYAVININNMIPVPDQYVIQLKYNDIENYRTFKNEKEKTNYIYLLQLEKAVIDDINEVLCSKAKKLYEKVYINQESTLAKRCCDFKLLEQKCDEWIKLQNQSQK